MNHKITDSVKAGKLKAGAKTIMKNLLVLLAGCAIVVVFTGYGLETITLLLDILEWSVFLIVNYAIMVLPLALILARMKWGDRNIWADFGLFCVLGLNMLLMPFFNSIYLGPTLIDRYNPYGMLKSYKVEDVRQSLYGIDGKISEEEIKQTTKTYQEHAVLYVDTYAWFRILIAWWMSAVGYVFISSLIVYWLACQGDDKNYDRYLDARKYFIVPVP